VFSYTDSVVRKKLTLNPIGEFLWNPQSGFKGQATNLVYTEEIDYNKIQYSIDSMKLSILDSMNIKFKALELENQKLRDAQKKVDSTPFWVYILLTACIIGIIYKVIR